MRYRKLMITMLAFSILLCSCGKDTVEKRLGKDNIDFLNGRAYDVDAQFEVKGNDITITRMKETDPEDIDKELLSELLGMYNAKKDAEFYPDRCAYLETSLGIEGITITTVYTLNGEELYRATWTSADASGAEIDEEEED